MSVSSPSGSNAAEIFSMCCAGTTAILSFSIILAGLKFPTLRRSHFFRIILAVATCDFLACVPYSFGYPISNTFCFIQGIFAFTFFRSAAFFTTALSYQIYSLCMFGKLHLREYHIHIIIWTCSLILTLLPFSDTVTYGNPKTLGESYCGITSTNNDHKKDAVWLGITLLLPALLNIILCAVFCTRISIFFMGLKIFVNPKIISMIKTLTFYPLALIITWLPVSCVGFYNAVANSALSEFSLDFFRYTNAIGSLYGTLLSIIFYSSSPNVRSKWYKFLCCYKKSALSNINTDIGKEISDFELYTAGILLSSPLSSLSFLSGLSSEDGGSTLTLSSTGLGLGLGPGPSRMSHISSHMHITSGNSFNGMDPAADISNHENFNI